MTSQTMTAPAAGTAKPRPVPWRDLAWVTLRQRRGLFAGLGALLGLAACYLTVMAIIQGSAYAAVAACHPAAAAHCHALRQAFIGDYWGGDNSVLQSGGAQTVSSLLFALPVLLGAFAGAPLLSRELDSGTFRFAWTQGAGRTRWALSTLVVPALVMTAATGAFTAVVFWYLRPFFALGLVSEMLPLAFALLGVAFAGWTLLACSLAAFLGALLRRTLPAMALTLVLYVGLAMATAIAIRPHYAAPVSVPSAAVGNGDGWVIRFFTRNGAAWTALQPDSRFWQFQLIEGGWLLGLSAALIAVTVWLVRRRGA
jgi:hypothetical protein